MNLIDELAAPVIFAHRGASKHAPENTMAAFDLAYAVGTHALELDTMLSRDGIPVVIHDHTVDRTTNGLDRVDHLDASELAKLDAGSSFSKNFRGEAVPLLKDVFVRFKDKLLINVELKNYHAPLNSLAKQVADLVKEIQNLDSILFSSFLLANLIRIRRLLPGAKTALLLEERSYWRILSKRMFSSLSPEFIHPYFSYITPEYLAKEHALDRRVNVWTVNDLAMAEDFIQWGVDGLITDDPERLLSLLPQLH